MICLARLGRRDRALLHYARIATLLRDDLGADPEPETAALADEIRSAQTV
jgi:DNA-binding SARP family transcriptional activator